MAQTLFVADLTRLKYKTGFTLVGTYGLLTFSENILCLAQLRRTLVYHYRMKRLSSYASVDAARRCGGRVSIH
jgi:hypothetical protein